MNDYAQPDFYRFNEDSLKLVDFVCRNVANPKSVLDLGAGSGIIGIEIANRFKTPNLVMVEAQSAYLPFLKQNVKEQLNSTTKCQLILDSFSNWNNEQEFDLIVSNPPYYLPGHGQSSSDERRNISRNFVLDGWEILLAKIFAGLSEEGRAFLVIKSDQRIIDEIMKYKKNFALKQFTEGNIQFLELLRLNIN